MLPRHPARRCCKSLSMIPDAINPDCAEFLEDLTRDFRGGSADDWEARKRRQEQERLSWREGLSFKPQSINEAARPAGLGDQIKEGIDKVRRGHPVRHMTLPFHQKQISEAAPPAGFGDQITKSIDKVSRHLQRRVSLLISPRQDVRSRSPPTRRRAPAGFGDQIKEALTLVGRACLRRMSRDGSICGDLACGRRQKQHRAEAVPHHHSATATATAGC